MCRIVLGLVMIFILIHIYCSMALCHNWKSSLSNISMALSWEEIRMSYATLKWLYLFSIQRIPMYVLFSSSSTFLLHIFYKGNFWNHYMEYWSMEHATFIHMLWHRHFLSKRHTFWICILKEFATIISLFDSQRPSRWTFTNTLHNWESIYL